MVNPFRLHRRPTLAVGFLATLTIVVIVLATLFLLWDLRKRAIMRDRLETVSITRMFMEQTERNFERADLILRGVQERLQDPYGMRLALNSIPVHLMLGSHVLGMRQIDALTLLDNRGLVVNSSQGENSVGSSVAGRPYFQAFTHGKDPGLFIDKPERQATGGGWSIHLARKIMGPDGSFRGVVVAALDIARLEQFYRILQPDYARPVSLYLLDGTLLVSVPPRDNMIGDRPPELGTAPLPPPSDTVRFFTHVKSVGELEAFTLGSLARFPLVISVTTDEDEALAAWRETAVPIVMGAALVSAFIGLVATLLSFELARQQKLERALGEARDRYHRTVDSVMDAIIAVDENQRITLFNPAASRMFGYSPEDIISKPLSLLIPSRHTHSHHMHVQNFMRSEASSRTMGPQLEITGVRADGSEFPIESTISHTLIEGRPQLTAVLRDVTERRRAEKALRDMNQQLRGLSAALESVREQERTRIARELHDELGQQLTGLKLDLSWLSSRLKEGRPASTERVDEMRRLLDTAIGSVRRISTELRPLILDDLGFGEALAWLSGEFGKRSGIEVSLDLQDVDLVQDNDLATALFRIIQESLTNVVRHANAHKVMVRIATNEHELALTVRDDGNGLSGDPRPGGFGLVSMRERANALGGNFSIISGEQGGTTVCVTLSLDLPIFSGASHEA
ncbi:MAG: PAS domain S-box protein [Betaproteobacteria bacterium]|nr:PAS domain S-box protein [Betaproteobacteria bacterium]MDE2623143.1 PAS domain S-box protein [Betaproteobacteria bacterium]